MDWLKACVQESGQTLYNREKKEWDYTNETKEPAKEAENKINLWRRENVEHLTHAF